MESTNTQKSQLAIIFFTVFLYLVGFGVIIPIVPILTKNFGATSFQIGLILSAYSLMQFIFAPFWGKLSDRHGRRPILLFCLLGESLAYIAFAWARSYEALLIARLFAGFFGASISTASAYISDITAAKDRSKGMALIGAAFGLGFLVGPALGGGLALWGAHISDAPHFDTSFAAYWVSGLCLLNFIFGFFYLKESLQQKSTPVKKSRFVQLGFYLRKPLVGPLIGVFFISSVSMALMEATLVLYVGDLFAWGIREVSFGFAYIGFIMVLCQGFIVRKLLPIVGEKKILFLGLSLMMLGFLLIGASKNIPVLAIAMTLLAVGNSFTNPATTGSISLLSKADEQGAVMGTTQGTASLGRIIGPAVGGLLYQQVSISSPFYASGVLVVLAMVLVFMNFARLPESAKGPA